MPDGYTIHSNRVSGRRSEQQSPPADPNAVQPEVSMDQLGTGLSDNGFPTGQTSKSLMPEKE